MKHIVAFGTFDTKGSEYKFLKECMERQFDGEIITVDIASLPHEPPFSPTIAIFFPFSIFILIFFSLKSEF